MLLLTLFACSRYLHLSNKAPLNQKAFLGPIRAQGRSTGKMINYRVLVILQRYKIDLQHCRGHVLDGTSADASKYKDASIAINEAYFTRCGNQF